MTQHAILFDGDTAVERPAEVQLTDGLLAVEAGEVSEAIEPGQLVRLYAAPGQVRVGRRDRNGWRLQFDGPVDPGVMAALPTRIGSLTPRLNRKAAAIGAGASALIVGLIASLFIAPDLAARQMPLSFERRIGDSVKFAPYVPRCERPDALAALGKIVDRLDPEARGDGFTIELLGVSAVNAAALPGGRLVVLHGLIDEAGNADAVAGVIAHEIAHVRRRHVASQAIRQLGLASVVAVIGGGDLSATAGGLLALKFGRDAEAEADADAVAMLERAGINPKPTAYLFAKMHRAEASSIEWLTSHPLSDSRAKTFTASYRADRRYRPALSAADEEALFGACQWPFLKYGYETAER